MRGAPIAGDYESNARGITPAHAGSTFTVFIAMCISWDHPRTCGEHLLRPLHLASQAGSPPHMRGARTSRKLSIANSRITPAHAGSTCFCLSWFCFSWDHPRTCGEHVLCDRLKNGVQGSPPHMRGAQQYPQETARYLRITPAHAGSTS